MVIVRHLSPSLIFIRLVTIRLKTERRFSSPRCLPLGLPLRPFRKRVALGGFPYPTSEEVSDVSNLLFFMKLSFLRSTDLGEARNCARNVRFPLASLASIRKTRSLLSR